MIRIEVTAEDIAKGKRRSACDCMIARALKRVEIPVDTVQPWDWNGDATGHGPRGTIDLLDGREVTLPFEAAEIARAWDDGHAVEPFAFDLDVTP